MELGRKEIEELRTSTGVVGGLVYYTLTVRWSDVADVPLDELKDVLAGELHLPEDKERWISELHAPSKSHGAGWIDVTVLFDWEDDKPEYLYRDTVDL